MSKIEELLKECEKSFAIGLAMEKHLGYDGTRRAIVRAAAEIGKAMK